MKSENGITLIGLVLAFVVLIILGATAMYLVVTSGKEETKVPTQAVNSTLIDDDVVDEEDEIVENETTDSTVTEENIETVDNTVANNTASLNTVTDNTVENDTTTATNSLPNMAN